MQPGPQLPQPIRHASGHGGRHAQGAVDLDEVVGEVAEVRGAGALRDGDLAPDRQATKTLVCPSSEILSGWKGMAV
jgi:hypothetical protein